MNIPLTMLVVYVAATSIICIVVAIRERVQQRSSTQYLTAEGGLAWYLIIPLLFAETMAGAATIGKAADGFTHGIAASWVNWGMALGMFLFVIFVARFYRAMNKQYGALSVPEAFKFMFDARCRMVMLLIVVIVYIQLYSAQPISAASLIAPMVGASTELVAWVVTALFVAVTLLGGMKGLAIMNIVHMVVMYGGLIWVAGDSVQAVGGLSSFMTALPADHYNIFGNDFFGTLGNALATAVSFLAAAPMVTAAISSRSTRDIKIGSWAAGCIIIPFAVLPAVIGMCGAIALPEAAPNTILFAMANSLGSVESGTISMAVAAAIWSSAPAALLFVANVLTQDCFVVLRPQSSDRQRLLFSKLAVVAIAVVATWIGLHASSILGQLYSAFQIRSVVGVVLVAAIIWPRVNSTAAFWSMLLGGVLAAVWSFAGQPFGINSLWPASALTIVVLVGLSMASKQRISESHVRYEEACETLDALEAGRSPERARKRRLGEPA